MSNESENRTCPRCGVEISQDAPQGLCPKCLLEDAALTTGASTTPKKKPQPPSIEELNTAFPHLEIKELIGQGGMGYVFKARQPKLERDVALKILPQSLAEDPAFAERFAREGRMLAKLNHPNIVTVYDFGEAGGYFYLLMEFVDGVNLRQAMRASRFTPEQALSIVPSVCEALQFAHDEGVLHRDIKPENILLDTKGRVKIADFGIAKFIEGRDAPPRVQADPQVSPTTLTQVGSSLGTPQYMAPEQIEKPGEVDHRADIYSLGVVFYELLTGELPSGDIAPPSSKTPVNPQVDEVVLRALEKERERRQSSATDFRTQVEMASKSQSQRSGVKTNLETAAAYFSKPVILAALISLLIHCSLTFATLLSALGFQATITLPLAAILVIASPILAIRLLRNADVASKETTGLLRIFSGVAFVLTLPCWGFGIFFLNAMLSERPFGWNPSHSEAVFVPLIWLGMLLLPICGVILRGKYSFISGGNFAVPAVILIFVGLGSAVAFPMFGFNLMSPVMLYVMLSLVIILAVLFFWWRSRSKQTGQAYLAIILFLIGPVILFGMQIRHAKELSVQKDLELEFQTANTQILTLEQKIWDYEIELGQMENESDRIEITNKIQTAEAELSAVQERFRNFVESNTFRDGGVGYLAFPVIALFCFPFVAVGTILGWQHLNLLRGTPRPHHGLVPAMFAALLLPLLLGYGLCALVFLLPLNRGSWVPLGILLTNLAAIVFAVWFIRWTWKWVRSGTTESPGDGSASFSEAAGKVAPPNPWPRRVFWLAITIVCIPVFAFVIMLAMYQLSYSPQDQSLTEDARSRFPKGSLLGANNASVFLVHDDASLHYALFHDGQLSSSSRSSNNPVTGIWNDDVSLTLPEPNGRTFTILREGLYPDELRIDGEEYDLREGRVFNLREDDVAEQMDLFPSLTTARDVAALNEIIQLTGNQEPISTVPGELYQGTGDISEFVALYTKASRDGNQAFLESMILREALNPEGRDAAIALLAPERPQRIPTLRIGSVEERLLEKPESFDHLPEDVEPRFVLHIDYLPQAGENYTMLSSKYFPVVEKDGKLYIGAFYSETLSQTSYDFGPTIERTIRAAQLSGAENQFLDLDTGELLDVPVDIQRHMSVRFLGFVPKTVNNDGVAESDIIIGEWARANGADLMFSHSENYDGMALWGGTVSTGRIEFDHVDAKQTTALIHASEERPRLSDEIDPAPWYLLSAGNTDALAFKTREGRIGVLQRQELINAGRDLVVRYKLLQTDSSGLDYTRALRELKSAMPTLEALENTLEQKDLESALTLASTALRQMQTYNIYVDGTSFEIPQGALDVFSLAIEALNAGNLERANTLFESSMNSVDIDLPENLEAFVNRNSNSDEVRNE